MHSPYLLPVSAINRFITDHQKKNSWKQSRLSHQTKARQVKGTQTEQCVNRLTDNIYNINKTPMMKILNDNFV